MGRFRSAPVAGSRAAARHSPAGSLPPEGLTLPMGALPFLLLQLAALALVFLMGYFVGGSGAGGNGEGGDGTVRAAEGMSLAGGNLRLGQPSGQASGAPAGSRDMSGANPVLQARADPGAPTALERAFLDETYVFTVSVFAADDTEYGRQQIRAVRDHLLSLGYPAVIPPKSPYPDRVVVCAGASASQNDLLELRDELRLLKGLDGRGRLCQDAWVDNIENYR